MTRTERQYKAARRAFIDFKGKGVIVAPPGFGKTRIALVFYNMIAALTPNATLAVIVPTVALKLQWEAILQKAFITADVYVINTAAKLSLRYDCIIVDEFHHMPAPTFIKAFINSKSKYFLGLTASPTRADKRDKLLKNMVGVADVVTLEECINNKWILDFEIINLGLAFSKREKIDYTKVDTVIKDFQDLHGAERA